MGGQTIELRPLTTGEFLELIYMGTDALHDALAAWVAKPEAYTFVSVLLNHIEKDDALKIIPMFLHVDREWLEEHTTPDEVYEAFRQAVNINDWDGIFQAVMMLDLVSLEEIMELWQTAKGS